MEITILFLTLIIVSSAILAGALVWSMTKTYGIRSEISAWPLILTVWVGHTTVFALLLFVAIIQGYRYWG